MGLGNDPSYQFSQTSDIIGHYSPFTVAGAATDLVVGI